jgi:hypothetical protein
LCRFLIHSCFLCSNFFLPALCNASSGHFRSWLQRASSISPKRTIDHAYPSDRIRCIGAFIQGRRKSALWAYPAHKEDREEKRALLPTLLSSCKYALQIYRMVDSMHTNYKERIPRLLAAPNRSFSLFGHRRTGKSAWLQESLLEVFVSRFRQPPGPTPKYTSRTCPCSKSS